jgi:hypothetical protein
MDVAEPRPRHRGFFLHSSDGESDTGEYENPEGFTVRVRTPHKPAPRRATGGRSHRTDTRATDGRAALRSGNVTGSRQRAHLPR